MATPVTTAILPAFDLYWATYERQELTPIIGWRVPNVGQPEPILPVPGPSLFGGVAVVSPDGTTTDLTSGVSFASPEIWRAYVHDDPPYAVGEKFGTPAPGKAPNLTFDGKPYAKTSFWKIVIDGYEAVFQLAGGEPTPTQPFVSKITRDDYFAARKVVPDLEPAQLRSGADDQPELPLSAGTDDDDDDIDDFV